MKKLGSMAVLALLAGWIIWPGRGLSHITTTNTVLFDREIVRILDAHCVACHASGSLAAPLVTYEQTWLDRAGVLAEVLARHMPPWAAVPGYGRFANDNSLTLRETQFLVSWVEGLGPRNDGTVFLNVRDAGDAPPPVRADVGAPEWAMGEPDLIRRLPARVVEPGEGERIERLVVDMGLPSELRVRGFEYRPGDRRVVRAAAFRLEATGQWLGSWTPWHGFVELPEGVAYRLPPGSRISAEIHYATAGERITDAGTIGFFLADESATSAVSDLVLAASGTVPPGTTSVRFHAEVEIEAATQVLSLWPEFGPGIQSMEVSVRRTDGGTDILLFARDIPIRWPTPYILAEPAVLQAGSRLRVTAYDANPSDTPRRGGIRLTISRYRPL